MVTRAFVLLVLLLTCYRDYAQGRKTAVPILPSSGKSISSFISEGWIVLDSAKGDLNKDNQMDLAPVLESKDSLMDYRYENRKDSPAVVQAKARVLVIAFRDSTGGGYKLKLQNNDFILRSDEGGCLGDPWNGLKVERGRLFLQFWGGCSGKWNLSYQFAYKAGDWQLIGATNVDYNPATGGEEWSYIFLTGRAKQTIMHADERINDNVKWHALKEKTLRTFKTFIRPFSWQVFPNVYL